MNIYPYSYTFEGEIKTLLWCSSEEDNSDEFLRSEGGVLHYACGLDDAKTKFKGVAHEINWAEEGQINFDDFWLTINQLPCSTAPEDCQIVIEGWNFIEDVLRTYSLHFLRKKLDNAQANMAYKKIFYGSNLDAFKSRSENFTPQWSESESLKLVSDLHDVWNAIGKEINELW